MMEYIKPGIVVNRKTIYPTGFEYVLAFAIHGCEWAIEKASTPEFREHIIMYRTIEEAEWVNKKINRLEKELKELKG